jgi:hypothetical protein
MVQRFRILGFKQPALSHIFRNGSVNVSENQDHSVIEEMCTILPLWQNAQTQNWEFKREDPIILEALKRYLEDHRNRNPPAINERATIMNFES